TVVHERSVSYRGIALRDVLHRAGPPAGIDVVRAIVIARGRGGYGAVYALVELEEDFTDKLIIAAEERDGEKLPEKEGPLRSVVEGEKLATRSVRKLVELTVRLIGNG
ncbi:MAG: molybdopterin-dependent oxidoreductase, partial [bacterium]